MSVLKKFRKAAQPRGGEAPYHAPKAPPLIPTYEGSTGDFRHDEFGNKYWMTPEQLHELAELNAAIDDDKQFWHEFRRLRTKHGLLPARPTASTTYRPTTPYTYKSSWTDPTKKKGFMSEWWSGWKSSWGSGAKSGQLNTKLAVAKRTIEVLLSVIDESGKPVSLRFSDDNDRPVSYLDMKSNVITISAKPMIDNLPDGEALDIMSGFTMHEAAHSTHTRKVFSKVEEIKDQPMAIAGLMANLAEDFRIEGLVSEEFPGFAGYFDKLLDYMWEQGKAHMPEAYGPDLISKVNSAIAIVRWEKPFREARPGKEWDPEFEWWGKWRDDYNDKRADIKTTVERALAHLRIAQPPETGKPDTRSETGESGQASEEMDAQQKAEEAMRDLDEKMRQYIEAHKDELLEACTHREVGEGGKVSAGANDSIGQLVQEEVEWEKPTIKAGGVGAGPPVVITHPKETPESLRYGAKKPDPLVGRYRAALVFRPDKEIHSTKLLKRGKVDGTQLYRWAVDDWRMFMDKGRKVDPRAAIYLLVDLSGSMAGGGKLSAAHRLATLFATALSDIDGVMPKVFGHTGDVYEHSAFVYRIWEPGEPLTRLGMVKSLPHSNNYDGYAIESVAKRLVADTKNGEQRLIVVLSDGYPAGHDYGGNAAEAHVKKVVDELRSKHRIRTLQIAIDTELDERRQKRMFDEFIPYKPGDSLDMIPKRLTKWLEKVL